MRLQHIIKERLWYAPGLITQYDMPMVNFQWTDYDQRHGFTQRPSVVHWREVSVNPITIVVDQPEHHLWRLRVSMAMAVYSSEQRARFCDAFTDALSTMVFRPLAPVWQA